MNQYRALTEKEIATLVVYGCTAENWKDVEVTENFSPKFVSNVFFSGKIKLGSYEKVYELPGGVKKHAGIFNAHIHNCSIGNDVYINQINNYIANYNIGDEVFIENVNQIYTEGVSSFGVGTKVSVLIESGGREIPIYAELSAPIAYMHVFHRHNRELTEVLNLLIDKQISDVSSAKGTIGSSVHIVNTKSLIDMQIGDYCRIEGASLLRNGTIVSSAEAPVLIGYDVQCDDFIIQSGSSVTDAAMLSRCFVGQGCLIGKQFSGMDSLFFANFQGLHGEAVAVFAGPYTVTHHKSTLMLTGYFSFMNAGSGTNFSNHMYKLGPIHQGITERGVKTSSGSYLMWPARIGAFSVVLGKHKQNPDTQYLPFSYIMETDGETSILPGINLHSAGTIRDVQKWPKRDLRKGEKLDPVIFDFLSPYTIAKALKGIDLLNDLLQNMDATSTFVWYQNCKMKKSSIRKGIELYQMAVDSFTAQVIASEFVAVKSIVSEHLTDWVDMAGLLAPKVEVEKLEQALVDHKLNLQTTQEYLQNLQHDYSVYVYKFVNELILEKYQKPVSELSDIEKTEILAKGKKADDYFNDMILRDARKEFNTVSKTGFGIDGDEDTKNMDFEATRGIFDEHPFVIERLSKEKN